MGLPEPEASIDSASSAKKTRIEYCAAAAAPPLFSQIQLLFISSSFSFLFPPLPALFLPSVLVLPSPRERGLDLWHVGRGREKGASSPSTTTPTSGKRQSFFCSARRRHKHISIEEERIAREEGERKRWQFFPCRVSFLSIYCSCSGELDCPSLLPFPLLRRRKNILSVYKLSPSSSPASISLQDCPWLRERKEKNKPRKKREPWSWPWRWWWYIGGGEGRGFCG